MPPHTGAVPASRSQPKASTTLVRPSFCVSPRDRMTREMKVRLYRLYRQLERGPSQPGDGTAFSVTDAPERMHIKRQA
eukprot:3869125-Rhodomonas_salina.4